MILIEEKFRAEWLRRLRSGDYPQTRGWLHVTSENYREPVGYCCLGVACTIGVDNGILVEQIKPYGGVADYSPLNALSFISISDGRRDDAVLMPATLVAAYFVDENAGEWSSFQNILVGMNDNHDTLDQIADYIEANSGTYSDETSPVG